jgi:predicted ATPase/class 3 adenylate cyclase
VRACPNCEAHNPEQAKFCLECGGRLVVDEPRPREVRKTVTVLFADVVGSTTMGERLDPEAVRHVMTDYFAAMRDVIERHGGTVEKFIGDAIMAVFGVPSVHEDDAIRAARAAVAMREALVALNAERGSELRVRTGICTGPVVAGVGPDLPTLVTGDTVNVAARLEQAAAPGEILVGPETTRLVREVAELEVLDPLAVRGRIEPVPVARLIAIRPGADDQPRRPDGPMVGRDAELGALRGVFDRAVGVRTAQLLTIFGTAGVGKSRLVREFVAALPDGVTVLRGRCLPYGEGITYWPVIEIVRAVAGIKETDDAAAARGRLDALLPEAPEDRLIAGRLAEVLGLEPARARQEELFWALRRLVEWVAIDRPVVLIVDDIHWAEPTLLDLIEHLADLIRGSAVLIIASARPELLEDRPTWGGGRLNATAILLEPLGESAATVLINQLVPGAALPASLRDRISGAAEGNPLYLEELIAMLVDGGFIRPADGERWGVADGLDRIPIPPNIQALLAARLDRLAPAERRVAERASIVGRVFEDRAVSHLSPEPERPLVTGCLTSLVRKDLIRPESPRLADEGVYRFRHILIRDAAYESVSKTERAALHERFAEWLAEITGDRRGEVEEIVGYHFEQAHRNRVELGLDDGRSAVLAGRAASRLGSAAHRAVARGDMRAAVNLLERTVALLPLLDPARPWLSIELADALGETGELARAYAILEDVVEGARASGDSRLEAHAKVVHWGVASELGPLRERAEADAHGAVAMFENAADEVGLARAWDLLSACHWEAGRGAEAEAAAMRAIEHARRGGRRRELALGYLQLSAVLNTGPTPVEDGIRRCEEVLRAEPDSATVASWMWHAMAHLVARLGRFDEARELAAKCLAILDELGQAASRALLSELVADVEQVAGDARAAMEVLKDGLEQTDQMGAPSAMLAGFLARNAWLAGDRDLAASAAARGLEGGGWLRAVALGSVARVRAAEGRHAEADAAISEALAYFETTDFLTFHAWTLRAAADVNEAAGRHDEAIAAVRKAIELDTRKGSVAVVADDERALAALDRAARAAG